jgi:hypothetical protein
MSVSIERLEGGNLLWIKGFGAFRDDIAENSSAICYLVIGMAATQILAPVLL